MILLDTEDGKLLWQRADPASAVGQVICLDSSRPNEALGVCRHPILLSARLLKFGSLEELGHLSYEEYVKRYRFQPDISPEAYRSLICCDPDRLPADCLLYWKSPDVSLNTVRYTRELAIVWRCAELGSPI
jgi:hypothetical protein